MATPRWRLMELAVLAAQLELKFTHSDPSSVDVYWDLELPDPDGDTRQVEVVVNLSSAGSRSQWLVEVQDRNTPLDKQDLGGFADKRREVGADGVTVVTTRGFTEGAARRIEREAGTFRAYQLVLIDGADAVGHLHNVDHAVLRFEVAPDAGPVVQAEARPVLTFGRLVKVGTGEVAMEVAIGETAGDDMPYRFVFALVSTSAELLDAVLIQPSLPVVRVSRPIEEIELVHGDGTAVRLRVDRIGGGSLKPEQM